MKTDAEVQPGKEEGEAKCAAMDAGRLNRIVGQQMRRIHRQWRLTQEKLAGRAGVFLSFVGHIERGARRMRVDTLYRLALALDCSANDLLLCGMRLCGAMLRRWSKCPCRRTLEGRNVNKALENHGFQGLCHRNQSENRL